MPVGASAAPAGSTLLVSRPNGVGAVPPAFDNASQTPGGVTPGGRYAVFTSEADGFVSGANPGVENVLLRDNQTKQTILVSRSDGANGAAANNDSTDPVIAIAPAGVMPTAPTNQPHVLVAFVSGAGNLVDHATGHTIGPVADEAWLRDVTADTTTLISRADGITGAPADLAGAFNLAIAVAPGGPLVAFASNAGNLRSTGAGGVYLRTVNSAHTELISCPHDDCTQSGTVNAFDPSLFVSGTNLEVAFDTSDTTITNDSAGHSQVMLALATAPQHPTDAAGAPNLFFAASVVGGANTLGNGDSIDPSIGGDGRLVGFLSTATNLTSDTLPSGNPQEAYLHSFIDTSTTLLSRASGASGAIANDRVDSVALGGTDADLRAVFATEATNLGGSDEQSYARDLGGDTTALLNRPSGATATRGNRPSSRAEISSDGSAALFTTDASNLGDGSGDRFERVQERSLPGSDVAAGTVSLVSRPSGTAPFRSLTDESYFDDVGSVSSDGRFVAFVSHSPSLPGVGDALDEQIYVRDLQTNRTILVSRATGANGAPANNSANAVDLGGISADGRFVEFDSSATNLSPQSTNGHWQVYVRDLVKNTTTLVSRSRGGAPAADGAFANGISGDGKVVLMDSDSPLDPAGGSGTFHLYERILTTGKTTLVDRDNGAAGAPAAGGFDEAAIDGDGNRVAFTSPAPLAGAPADNVERAFVRDLKSDTTILASRANGPAGLAANAGSSDVAIDGAGDEVAFDTEAQNLGATFINDAVFVRHLTSSVTQIVSNFGTQMPATADSPSLDATGDRVSFLADGSPLDNGTIEAFVRDLHTQATVLASRANGAAGLAADGRVQQAALDPTGDCLAFVTPADNLADGFGSLDFESVHLRVLRGNCPALPPALSELKVKPRTLGRHGVAITFKLTVAATVTVRFTQLVHGRKHGKRCVAGAKHGTSCTITHRRGKLTVDGHAGANKLHFGGKLNGKRLPKGHYRLTATPAGGKAHSTTFTIAG